MKRLFGPRFHVTLIAIAIGGLILGCGGDDTTGPPQPLPEPGQLRVTLSSSTPVGAVMLTVSGTGITSPAASGGTQVYHDVSGSTLSAVVVGASLSGEIMKFTVPDVKQVAGYEVSVEQVAGPANQPLATSGISVSVVQ